MAEEVHQLATVNMSTVEAVTEAGAVIRMLRLHLHTYLDRPGHPTERRELPGVAMTPAAALDLAEAIRLQALAMQQQAGGPPPAPSPGQTLN